ncbi:unnamed protein product [Fusarium graminearum]|uniref:Chromosome 4, complete genome n=1 Tax=Gibberella zeae (strain ATCC MYA-4620 / CBS 123657 / FGSC 9075 / NRRL 31084 / PH-1) TaxID=229533 RepID=I1S9V1_GIBZE|nr:hypothetical protein FGSG_13632 [Fusarium graminearum PH-1]ESU16353.1 hypothetical protein FGSG_13632 [Fusarium graminearum PH-1]EYB29830.1 hypothetical protein FG05_13632 [Fusarium graminearum]CEF83044.1 unnamed protein product [Fusarium graminearum]CZS74111.1 unnamed protein product [Fusarium graminearum]|eukprot:XP_011327963.1 hypothetical protein FGSG_13632 [Fusarium graminearum PH-1]
MELDMGSITNRRNTTSACPSWNHAKVKHKNLKFCYEKAHTSVKGENDRPAPTIAGQRVTLDQARSRGVPRITRDHIRTAAICKAQAQAKPTAQLNEVRSIWHRAGALSPESSSGPEEQRLICPRALNARDMANCIRPEYGLRNIWPLEWIFMDLYL